MPEQKERQKEAVVSELGPLGRYKLRLVDGPRGRMLDIREWIDNSSYSGFTRRGVRLAWPAQAQSLIKILAEALASSEVADPAKQ